MLPKQPANIDLGRILFWNYFLLASLYLFFMATFGEVILYLYRQAKGKIKKIKLCPLTDQSLQREKLGK